MATHDLHLGSMMDQINDHASYRVGLLGIEAALYLRNLCQINERCW